MIPESDQCWQAGDVLHLLHIIPTCHPFGSGVFTVSQPSSPRKSADFEEKLEVDQARNWMEDRFAAVAKESDVRKPLFCPVSHFGKRGELSFAMLPNTIAWKENQDGCCGATSDRKGNVYAHLLRKGGSSLPEYPPPPRHLKGVILWIICSSLSCNLR